MTTHQHTAPKRALNQTTHYPAIQALPPYDPAYGTRRYCTFGLYISGALALASLGASFAILPSHFGHFQAYSGQAGGIVMSSTVSLIILQAPAVFTLVLSLVLNFIVASCTDTLSYIHYVSLRWALFQEERLHFNSNLRLFISAKHCASNRWPCNLASAGFLVMSYTAASQVFFRTQYYANDSTRSDGLIINSVGMLMLGVGLLGQVLISTWCLFAGRKTILSWSASPLNTALACLHNGLLHHRPGRGMMPVHSSNLAAQPAHAFRRQQPMIKAYPTTRHLIYLLASMVVVSLILAFVIFGLVKHLDDGVFAFFDRYGGGSTFFNVGGPNWPVQLALFCLFLFGAVLQAFITMALHCAELLVNVSRDEKAWRAGASTNGAALSTAAIKSAAWSWEWWFLFVLKPVAQWLFASSGISYVVGVGGNASILFNPVPLFVLAGASGLLLVFAVYLTWRRPKGPQPATFGHLQTLVDLIDDWGMGNQGRLWWGAKEIDRVGLVGTTADRKKISPVNFDVLYQ